MLKWLRIYEFTDYFSRKQLRDYQFLLLKDIAKKHNLQIDDWDDFYNLPLTTKQDIQEYSPKDVENTTTHQTSGSTGYPLKVYGPNFLQQVKSAIFERAWKKIRPKKVVRLTAGEPKWKFYDFWRNIKPHNYRNINQHILDYIIKHKPLIHGQAGAIREITTKLIRQGHKELLGEISVYLMSEDVREHKEELKKYYGGVYSGYGLAELCTVATDCVYENCHVNMETCIVEIINGEIVVTDLLNDVTPIIRYRTGDYGKLMRSKCFCGKEHDILYGIEGRGIDYSDVGQIINWRILSPISRYYLDIIKSWKAEVNLKKKELTLFVVWKYIPDKLIAYREFLQDKGLTLKIVTKKSLPNKKRMKLLKIK